MSTLTKRDPLHSILDDMRGLSLSLLKQPRYASAAGDVLLLVGVAIGDAEKRPFTANKLATYIGMPRATVIRKLAYMVRDGLVEPDGRCFILSAEGRRRMHKAVPQLAEC